MDEQTMSKVVQWIQSNVGEQTSKQELTQKMQGSDIGSEAQQAVGQLPDGQLSKQQVIDRLRQQMMAGVGTSKGDIGEMVSGAGGGAFGSGTGGG